MENVAANALFLNEPCDDDVEMIKKTRWIHEWKKAAKLPNCKKRKWKPKNKNQIQKLKCQSFLFSNILDLKKKKWKKQYLILRKRIFKNKLDFNKNRFSKSGFSKILSF